jgi:hypothetical protein
MNEYPGTLFRASHADTSLAFFAQNTPGTAFRDTHKCLKIPSKFTSHLPCRISVLAYFCGSFSKTCRVRIHETYQNRRTAPH